MCPHKPASGGSKQDEGEKFIGWAVVSASSMAPSDLHPLEFTPHVVLSHIILGMVCVTSNI